ncbi:hypothetical protein CCH79_00001738 [Gambusia affinis]|uniref:Glutathione-dependent dehydroascorbate reductase n=1 Tax=Gambusia affinis TaxID=33528 RepID=A0A315VRQ1_GAMAF|nr:hypothetical protein CCH79_00001738 [Gambusia affinis]
MSSEKSVIKAYPEKKLLPSTPLGKARQRMTLEHFSKHLVKEKTKFFDGDTIRMIDYMLWPFFETETGDLQPYLDNTPELKKWRAHMLEDSAVKATVHKRGIPQGLFQATRCRET